MSALPPPGTRCAVYARFSTHVQTFKSTEDQLTLYRAYAHRQGWVGVGAYHNAERSGTTKIGRAGLFASATHGLVDGMKALGATVCTASSGEIAS